MTTSSKKNMLLLSGSKSQVGLPKDEKPVLLEWAAPWIKEFCAPIVSEKKPLLVVAYARPDAMSEKGYFKDLSEQFDKMGIETICAPPEGVTEELLNKAGGIFIGGGHTYTLLEKLQKSGSLDRIRTHVENGLPYIGSSAGTIIACPTIKTTNDMPGGAHDVIDTRALGLIPAQLNCHYLDKTMENPDHHGETRDTRLKEVCGFNPGMTCLGLYEGQALHVTGNKVEIWTSDRARGTRSPLFRNDPRINKPRAKHDDRVDIITRGEIECEVDVPKDISRIFKMGHPAPEANVGIS